VDTGAFVALMEPKDQHHPRAKAFFERLPSGTRNATTQAVVAECYTFLLYRYGRASALRCLQFLNDAKEAGTFRFIYNDERDAREAESLLRRFNDQAISYVDALTLASAGRYNIGAIFGFDHQLALTGIPLLPGPS
jgi:predicted nucleic acid-binding protein